MSEEITLNVSIALLEELRCFICKNYLSCSPIRSLPSGNCICGSCSPSNAETPTHRLMALESLLCKLQFPCVFKKFGCKNMLMYGKTTDHESKCVYKPFACPMNNFARCLWAGTALHLVDHFKDKHPNILKSNVEFKLEIDKDAQGIVMATENSFTFILKYFYTTDQKILKYQVSFCTTENDFEVFYTIQLLNGIDSECNMNLKTLKCCLYDENFSQMLNAKVLNLKKCLEYLGQPDCIVVAMKPKVGKSNDGNITPEGHQETHSDLIKYLRCCYCQDYLIPPLFDLDGKAICCDCTDGTNEPLDDQVLLKCVNEAMYPCHWRDCTVLSNSKNFKDHHRNCQFQLYGCVYKDCDITFLLCASISHLESHKNFNPVFVTGGITYKTSFGESYGRTDIIVIKNNRITLIQHKMFDSGPPYKHRVNVATSPDDAAVSGIVVLEHIHCKLKSKEFFLSYWNNLDISFEELPFCFKEKDELLVTVELIM